MEEGAEECMEQSSGPFKVCSLCGCFEYSTIPMLLSHLRIIHSSDPRFHVTCGVDGCSVTSRSFSALYSHIYRRHPGIVKKRQSSLVHVEPQVQQLSFSTSMSQNSDDHTMLDSHAGIEI